MTRKGKPQRGAMCGQIIESRYLCIISYWHIEVKETKANLTLVWLPLSPFYCCFLGQKATQRSVRWKKLSKRGWAKNKDIFLSRANNKAEFSTGFFFSKCCFQVACIACRWKVKNPFGKLAIYKPVYEGWTCNAHNNITYKHEIVCDSSLQGTATFLSQCQTATSRQRE